MKEMKKNLVFKNRKTDQWAGQIARNRQNMVSIVGSEQYIVHTCLASFSHLQVPNKLCITFIIWKDELCDAPIERMLFSCFCFSWWVIVVNLKKKADLAVGNEPGVHFKSHSCAKMSPSPLSLCTRSLFHWPVINLCCHFFLLSIFICLTFCLTSFFFLNLSFV